MQSILEFVLIFGLFVGVALVLVVSAVVGMKSR
jgi:hypothetical protein